MATSYLECEQGILAPRSVLLYPYSMPALKNIRHDRFAQKVAEGESSKSAYIEAGFRARDHAAEVEASKLLRKPDVASRVEELRGEAARRNEITVDVILAELEEA